MRVTRSTTGGSIGPRKLNGFNTNLSFSVGRRGKSGLNKEESTVSGRDRGKRILYSISLLKWSSHNEEFSLENRSRTDQ